MLMGLGWGCLVGEMPGLESSSPPWPLGWASTASACRGQGEGCPQLPRPSCQVGGFRSQEPGGTPSSLLVPLSSLFLFPPTSRELQGDTCRLLSSSSCSHPRSLAEAPVPQFPHAGTGAPHPLRQHPRWLGEAWRLWGAVGRFGGGPRSASCPCPPATPPFPGSREPSGGFGGTFKRVLIIDGAGSVPWRFAGPSPPAFLKVEARSLVASPHPGPWCPSHPRQTRPEGELVREGGGGQALVSPPSPLRRPQFPVELGEFLLDLLPVSPSPGPGPLVSPGCLETPHYRPRPSPLCVERLLVVWH